MNTVSTAYILIRSQNLKYAFDGVTSVSHALSLRVATEADASSGSDYVNNARNEPDVVTLSVVISDANTAVQGWSRGMMTALSLVKEYRLLCQVVTSLRTYENMLLTSFSVQQDENCPDGWTGTLTFTHSEPPAPVAAVKTENYSSAPVSSGSAAKKTVGRQGGSVLQTILREAGIR